MRRFVGSLFAILLAFGPCKAEAENRAVILNYADPHGAALALAIVPRTDQLPSWMRGHATLDTKAEIGQFALPGKSATDKAGHSTTYLFSSQRSTADGAREVINVPRLKLESALGQAVEIQPTSDALANLPLCVPRLEQQAPCRVSDLSRNILDIALRRANGSAGQLGTLLASRGLVTDHQAAKRVIVATDAENAVQHVDFVGIVRGRDEKLLAPDATSVFVVRLDRSGVFTIVERRQDSSVDSGAVRFTFGEQ